MRVILNTPPPGYVAAPAKKKTAKKTAKKKAPAATQPTAIDVVVDELRTLTATDITTPENAPSANWIYARMMLLYFIVTAVGLPKPDGISAAMKAANHYFLKTKRTKKELDQFFLVVRKFSELHNCRLYTEAQIEHTMLLLDIANNTSVAVKADNGAKWEAWVKWNPKDITRIHVAISDTANYIKAYNMTIDIMAEQTHTPELVLVKKDVGELIDACRACRGVNAYIDSKEHLDELAAEPPPNIKQDLRREIEFDCGTTLLTRLIGAVIDLTKDDLK